MIAASLFLSGRAAWAQTPAPVPAAPPAITITLDDMAVRRLIDLIDAHDSSPASIDAWLALPASREMLKVGLSEGTLTETQLRTNLIAVITGTATDATQPRGSMGRLLLSPLADYKMMLADLETHRAEWTQRAAARAALYAPPGTKVAQTVYLHVGGDWDAINRDGAIYINMAFFHDYYRPSWQGIDSLMAHETFHAVQNQAYGNPEQNDTADHAFLSALSKIQREGTARLVETEADPGPYSPVTYGFYFRALDYETLRAFPDAILLLTPLTSACYPHFDRDKYGDAVGQGLDSGGPYYIIGHGMASAIEKYEGRAALIRTVREGPVSFFRTYNAITAWHPDLPRVPADTMQRVYQLASP
jgi:hypothetical protein